MTRIVRDVNAETLAEIGQDHTQSFHLVRIDLASGSIFLSEGRTFLHEGNVYVEGMVRVSDLRWAGDGSQFCTLQILNEDNYAATLMLLNQIADAAVTIWTVNLTAEGGNTTPVLYATGACDASQLSPEQAEITVITSKYRTAFMPNYYMGSAGFNHIPPEGAVVFWNSTGYLLERDDG